ncbi:hypothetical protein HNS03_24080 [Amorphus sp. 3PC139-8]
MTEIGRNALGEIVLRDEDGRYFRRVTGESGPELVSETSDPDFPPPLFLRAHRADDLPSIARGLLQMAAHGTVTRSDFARVVEAACEEGPHGRLNVSADDAAKELRKLTTDLLIRERFAPSAKAGDPQAVFQDAVRLGNRLADVLSAGVTEDGYRPMPAATVALRRAIFGAAHKRPERFEVAGSRELGATFGFHEPPAELDAPAVQVMDLTGIKPEALVESIMQRLARRDTEGRSLFILAARSRDQAAVDLRHELGTRYVLETVADLGPIVAGGRPDAGRLMLFGVGAKRPTPLAVLPEAARRTMAIDRDVELWSWSNEVLRSQRRVSEWLREANQPTSPTLVNREENENQVPYRPLSQARPPFTMIPVGLEGATSKALVRLSQSLKDGETVDGFVARRLGFDESQIGQVFSAEQVDAVALGLHAEGRGRGYMLVDQTGIGKGRSLAALARAALRDGKRVIYFTETGQINVPDVWRDMVAVGADREAVPLVIANNARVAGPDGAVLFETMRPRDRKAFYKSEQTDFVRPDGEVANLVLATYSNFSAGLDSDACDWLWRSVDGNTVVILDEAHNALSPRSNTGVVVRTAIERSTWTVYGTATWQRTPEGVDLYSSVLPQGVDRDAIERSLHLDGAIAQEAFATMLAEDGVLLRRDHDLANIEFEVRLPSDRQADLYRAQLDALSEVVSGMLDASVLVSRRVDQAVRQAVQQARGRGLTEEHALLQAHSRNQYSINFGSPLLLLTKVYLNGMKVDQVVENAIKELGEGRKPLISFHSTSEALLKELMREEGAAATDEDLAAFAGLGMRDQVRRIHERLYKVKLDNGRRDIRETDEGVRAHSEMVLGLIDGLPDIPVSPVDAVIEGLEAAGFAIGELSGRTFCYRNDRIEKRQGTNRAETVARFNNGELDAMIYNGAGATGGSYHASPEFRDQRPRTMIEMETHPDIIKYVQGQGRGNRFGQVAKPRVASIVSGLTPEMRLLAFRNQKLRRLGASVDANRSHPLLVEEIPDLINPVGDKAARRVLLLDPMLARRLGMEDVIADDQSEAEVDYDTVDDSRDVTSLASKLLARSIILSPDEQTEVYERLCNEFEALVEELDSRRANPLRPLTVEGEIEILETTLFEGHERAEDDVDESAFTAPLYMHTGRHHYTEQAIGPDELMDMIDRALGEVGPDGFLRHADELIQMRPALLQPFVPVGMTLEEAEEAGAGGPRLARRAQDLDRQIRLLEELKPGVQMTFPTYDMERFTRHTVVGLVAPGPRQRALASGYKVDLVAPGDCRPRRLSLSTLTGHVFDEIRFHRGFSRGPNASALDEFRQQGEVARKLPVQVLTGNTLLALQVARRHKLGAMSLYRDKEGQWHRGVVVHANKVDLTNLPVRVAGTSAIALLLHNLASADGVLDEKPGHLWSGDLQSTPLEIRRMRKKSPRTDEVCESLLVRARKVNGATLGFWRCDDGDRAPLHRFLTGVEIPREMVRRRGYHEKSVVLDGTAEGTAELRELASALSLAGVELKAAGKYRARAHATRNIAIGDVCLEDGALAQPEPEPRATGPGRPDPHSDSRLAPDAEPIDDFDGAGTWEIV